jgi:membrane protein required for beta-lactamase induction
MTLIALIICLVLEIFWPQVEEYRRLDWFGQYTVWLQGRFGHEGWWNGAAGVVMVLLAPLLAAGIIQSVLASVWLGLFELVFGIFVLTYCLRFQPLDRIVELYCDAKEAEDESQAELSIAEVTGKTSATDEDVTRTILVQSNERLFSVLFWFFLLGPLGALLCRLSFWLGYESSNQENDFADTARRLQGILSWAPARLLAAGYVITGSFEDAVHAWRECTFSSSERNLDGQEEAESFTEVSNQILYQTGMGALRESIIEGESPESENHNNGDESGCAQIQSAHGLVLRTIVAWGMVVALVTLAGWVS